MTPHGSCINGHLEGCDTLFNLTHCDTCQENKIMQPDHSSCIDPITNCRDPLSIVDGRYECHRCMQVNGFNAAWSKEAGACVPCDTMIGDCSDCETVISEDHRESHPICTACYSVDAYPSFLRDECWTADPNCSSKLPQD